MAAPFAYPQFYYPTPYISPFYNTPHVSPFIPPVALPGSPNLAPQPERHVRWEDDPPFPRQRRPSWHGAGPAAPANAVPFPSPPIYVTPLPPMVPLPAQAPMPAFTHQRRRSDTCLPLPAWVTYPTMLHPATFQSPQPAPAAHPQIHPLLDGETAAGPKLLFDLSYHTFSPQRITSYNQTSGTPLTLEELLQPATHPPVRRMTIRCELVPDWPIVLEPHTTSRDRSRERSPFLSVSAREAQDAPITVYDVLMAIYRTLQRRITQTDWARLSTRQVTAISSAYTRRSRTYPSVQAFEDAQGVRRVDYLVDQYMFRGIMRESVQDGFSKMKLLVGPAR